VSTHATLSLLGSGGWMPAPGRETGASWMRRGRAGLLLDAGTGVRRLVQRPEVLAGPDRLDIVLTHFHLDHVIGLTYLPLVPLPPEVALWAPGRSLYGTSTLEILARLVGEPFLSPAFAQPPTAIGEIGPGPVSAGPFELEARRQDRHPHPTLALRHGDDWTYCTDTGYDPDTAAFARGSAALFHDTWCTSDDPRDETGHTCARDAGRLADAAGVDELVLMHLHPLLDDGASLVADAATAFGSVRLGEDAEPR
jgi:ribonuclease BN (tRNA processing enzyme)